MKKLLAILLALILVLTFTACGEDTATDNNTAVVTKPKTEITITKY